MALENILLQEIVQKLGWTLLHFVWQAATVALLVGILLALLRKSAANLRYIVACAALGLIVLLPIITMQLVTVSTPQPIANIEPAPVPVIPPTQQIREIPALEMNIPEVTVQQEITDTAFTVSWKQRTSDLLEPALPYIVSAWLLGVFGLSLWHLGGWAQLQRLRKKMVRQVDVSVHNKLRRLSEKLQVKRAVQLLESALVQVPTVVGWLRPVILLPASALTGLTAEQLEALLAHELAHIRRYDYLVNMLQTVVETLGFYHPAMWWISHKIRAERENCCDDLAVSISGDRIRYARALTSMEEIRGRSGELAVAASGGNLFSRIRRLIDRESTESSRTSWIPSAITILLIAIVVIPTTLALTGQNKTQPSAEFLLNKMLEHRSKVRNLQYVAEDNIWRDPAAEQDRIEEQIKSMRESGISERQLERIRQSRTEAPESSYQILRCTVDEEERIKIEQTGGTYDSSGKKVPRGDKHIWAWNGILGTELHQSSGLPASATIKDTPQMATRLWHPWKSFTGIFCGLLEEAIAAEIPVSVEKLEDNTYRVAFVDKTRRIAAIISPSHGYTCPLIEYYNEQGQLTSRSTVKCEEVAGGIWFPVSGKTEDYSPNDSVRYRSTSKLSQIRINDPAFNAVYFDVDMPEGTAVRDEMQNKQYVVGSKRVQGLDLDKLKMPLTETGEVDSNSWQERFYSIYRLEDGQVLKRIAPPFIRERRGYFLFVKPGRYSSNTYEQLVSQRFYWDGKLSIMGARVGSGIPRLKSSLESVIGLGNRQYDIPPDILSADMSGDWIVRKDTPQEELLQALEQIVKDETSRDIDFVKQKVETEVIIAKGKYNFQLLPNITDGQYVLICTNNTDTYTGGGGGSGTLDKFLRWVGNRVGMNVIDQTEAEGIELSWRNHDSSDLNRLNHNAETYNQRLSLLLKNLSWQTGLKFERKTATVEKWYISEKGTIKAPQKTDSQIEAETYNIPKDPLPAKSADPSMEDKTIVKVDLSVVEVFSDSKFDRETTIAIENLLGGKITLPDSPAAADLLRRAAKATAAVKDESAGDKRVTQEQFGTLFDMLVSRGFVKILMNPTLEVVDGQTAKISSKQKIPNMQAPREDLIEITANVLDDGTIDLQAYISMSTEYIVQEQEQKPIFDRRSISTRIHLSPGQSVVIGGTGTKQAGLITEPGKDVKDSKAPATEILVILTPTVVETTGNQQNEIDEPTEISQEQRIAIRGRCRDSGGRPLSNVQVFVFCRDYKQGILTKVAESETDSEGHFTFGLITPPGEEDLRHKSYLVFVPANGHGPAWKNVNLYEPNNKRLELTAYNPAVVTGSIITEDSEPINGVKVWVQGIISPEATEDPASRANDLHINAPLPGWSAVTEQDGSFRIAGVPDGSRIRLYISHSDFAGTLVHVKPGFDSKIKVQPAAAITGRVLFGKTGKPAACVLVKAQGVESVAVPGGHIMPWAQTVTDEQGRYKLESLYGLKYNIWAEAENLTVVALDSFQAVTGQIKEAPDLHLIEGGFITGRVIDFASGRTVKPGKYSYVSIHSPSRPESGAAVEGSLVREDGSFRIRVAPGRNYIHLQPMDDWGNENYVVSPNSRVLNVQDGQTIEIDFKLIKLTEEEKENIAKYRKPTNIKLPIFKTIDEVEQPTKEEQPGTEAKEPPGDKPVTRVYDIYDLVLVGARISRGTVDVMMDGSGGMGGQVNIPDQAIVNEAQNIVNLIMQTIAPNSWHENNPSAIGTISPFPPARPRKLAIYQTLPAHQQIEKLLKSRREQTYTTQISIELRYLYTNVEFLDEVRDSMDIEFKSDTFLNDKQVETLLRASQKSRDIRSLMAPRATVLNNETARFSTARESFMSFLDYSEPNNLSQPSTPAPVDTFCTITPHIEDNKNIIIDFVQDIPGLQERIIYDRREMVQSYTETTAITNKRIPNNKTFAFTCDIIKSDQDNQTALPDEKKTLIVLIKPTIIVPEEMPRSEAAAMILNSQRSKGYTAEQPDDTIVLKPAKQEQPGTGKDQIMIDTKILTASDEFMKYIGLDPNSVANSEGWANYRVHTTDDSTSFVIDQLHADLILKAFAARMQTHKDIQILEKPQILAMAGKKFEIHITDSEHYMLIAPAEPNGSSVESESKSKRIELGTTVRLTPNLTPDGKKVDLDFEWEYRRLRGVKEHTGPDGNVQKVPQIDVDSIKTPCTVPDGKTLLITGKKITEQMKKGPRKPGLADLPLIGGLFSSPAKTGETRNLLILIKPNINPPKKAPPKSTPIDPNDPLIQPIDPNDPLIKKLGEKFKRYDEQK